MKSSPFFLLAALLGACAADAPVETEFNPTVDFSRYRSFSFAEPRVDARENSVGHDPRVLKTIMETIRADLVGRPMELEETGADLSVAVRIAVGDERRVISEGYTWDPSGGRPAQTSFPFEEGTLVIDFFDTSSDQLVWRAWSRTTVSRTGDPDLKMLEKLVLAMLEQYPPDPEED